MQRAIAVLAIAGLAGCVTHHRIVVDGGALYPKAHELETVGHARVLVHDIHDDGDRGRTTYVTIDLDQELWNADARRSVREWIRNCGPGKSPCALSGLDGIPLEVRHYDSLGIRPILVGTAYTVVVGGVIAAVACGLACADGSTGKRDSEYALIGFGAVVGVGLVYIVVSCFVQHNCRD
jgi:hypothetical protein